MSNIFSSVSSVARKYAQRPGCRFLGAEEVGIAVFVMDLRVIVVESRDLSPIDEFLLRALRLEIGTPRSLSNYLGLDRRTVRNRLVELRRAELIDIHRGPISDDDDVRCHLTIKGTTSVESLERSDLREITIPGVVYHGFLRRPVIISEEQLLRPRELKGIGLRKIRALPLKQPMPDEIRLSELSEVVKRQWKLKKKGKPPELISVRSILRNVRNMYLPAVLLQYQLLGAKKQRQFAFAVDGVVIDEYARAFSERNGPDRHPELFGGEFRTAAELASDLLRPETVTALGPLGDLDDLYDQLESVEDKVQTTEATLEESDRPDTRQVLRQELDRVQEEKKKLEEKLAHRKIFRLNTNECRELIKRVLAGVKERLVIESAFISADVIDRVFLQQLATALARGVNVWIIYGMGKQGGRNQNREQSLGWDRAATGLTELRKRHKKNFKLLEEGNTHRKIVILDHEFVVTGSWNWLSYKGGPGKGYRLEDVIRLTDPCYIEEYFNEITGRFDSES